jgi:hypothetical protein
MEKPRIEYIRDERGRIISEVRFGAGVTRVFKYGPDESCGDRAKRSGRKSRKAGKGRKGSEDTSWKEEEVRGQKPSPGLSRRARGR